jgi:hypothetical protein
MKTDSGNQNQSPSGSALPELDRRVLLGTLFAVLSAFAAAWIAARGFLPGAQLFPYFVSGVGITLTIAALTRVWRRLEPSAGPGQTVTTPDQSRATYRRAITLVGSISAYYLAIYFIGFMPATALFVVVFARTYSQSYLYAAGAALAALLGVFVLSYSLDLFLPRGLIVETLFGG